MALIGGMDRLRNHYIAEADKFGVNLRVFNETRADITASIQHLDVVVIFTGKVSHLLRNEVMRAARERNILVLMCHSCGVCSLRHCIACLMDQSLSLKQ